MEIVNLPKINDPRGNLTFIEGFRHIPFDIERVFWIYDVPGGEVRGGHAYKTNQEFIIAISGSFDLILNDGINEFVYSLNRSYMGVYVPSGTWRQMVNFSTNSLALIIASTHFSEKDYIRNINDFYKINFNYKGIYSILKNEKKGYTNKTLKSTFTIIDCLLLNLSKIQDRSGNITVLESGLNIFFSIERVFYLYDIPSGESRGAHAHKKCHQFIIALSGSFEVELDDGKDIKTIFMNRPDQGLYIPPSIWASERNFSAGSICLVLTSDKYDELDYIRNYNEFLTFKNES